MLNFKHSDAMTSLMTALTCFNYSFNEDEKNGNDKDLPRGMHCILGAHPAVSVEADVSSRPLLLARAEDPDRRGVEEAAAEDKAEGSAAASEAAADSPDRFCLLADPGPDDDPPCLGKKTLKLFDQARFQASCEICVGYII